MVCYKGRGALYLRLLSSSSEAYQLITRTSEITLTVAEEVLPVKDFRYGVGATVDLLGVARTASLGFTVHSNEAEALKVLLKSAIVSKPAIVSTVTVIPIPKVGGFYPLAQRAGITVSLVDSVLTPLVSGVHFLVNVNKTGLTFLSTSGLVGAVTLSYNSVSQVSQELLTGKDIYYGLFFDGVNKVTQEPLTMRLFKVGIPLNTAFSVVSNDYNAMEVDAQVLADFSLPTSPTLSNYGQILS